MMSEWEAYLRERDYSPLTITRYLRSVAAFAAWYRQANGRDLRAADLTRPDVRDYRAHLQTVKRARPGTINAQLAALRAWGAWLARTLNLPDNPCADVRGVSVQRAAPKWLERRQLAALEREAERAVNAAQTAAARYLAVRNRALLMLLAHSGLRVAELTALQVADLSIGERSGWVEVRAGKGGKARRVPLNVEARRPLNQYLDMSLAEEDPYGFVFCDWSGAPLRPRAVQRILARYGRRAGVPVTPHTLRHTFAKALIDAGVRETEVADLLGHSRLDTTRLYTRPSERDLERAVERLEG